MGGRIGYFVVRRVEVPRTYFDRHIGASAGRSESVSSADEIMPPVVANHAHPAFSMF